MTPEELQAIEARAAAATPGPWRYDGMHPEITTPQGENYWLIISECRSTPDQELPDQFDHWNDKNYHFIAHARTDIPALVAEVKRLQKELARAEGRIGKAEGFMEGFIGGLCQNLGCANNPEVLAQEVEGIPRLRTALEEIWECDVEDCCKWVLWAKGIAETALEGGGR